MVWHRCAMSPDSLVGGEEGLTPADLMGGWGSVHIV